jgi:hypothetical protein
VVSYRILITGSRDWPNDGSIEQALVELVRENGVQNYVVVHGAAKGADTIAAHAAWQLGMTVEAHPAQWQKHTDACPDWHHDLPTCKMAGHRRNAEMVDARADTCLAFIKDESRGATACAALAEKAGIPVRRYVL